MSAQATIAITAEVAPTEQPAIRTGAELLIKCLRAARPELPQRASLGFCPPDFDATTGQRFDIHIASMLPELDRPREARSAILDRWMQRIQELQGHARHVFLCTIFRHVAHRGRDGKPDETLVRIRELNLMVADLSQSLGVNVIDIDSAMAAFGARDLGTDHTLRGPLAEMVAGHAVANAILAANLDDLIDPALQEGAQRALGEPSTLGTAIYDTPAGESDGA